MVALSLNTITNFLFGKALISSPTYGEIMADVKMSEDHTRKNEVTQNTLESGAVIADHVIIHPRVLSINFGVTNTGWTSLLESRSQEIFDKLDNISRTQAYNCYNRALFLHKYDDFKRPHASLRTIQGILANCLRF